MLIHDVVEIKCTTRFTVVISFLQCPSSLATQRHKRKQYTLIDVPSHGEQTEPNPVFVACFSREL